MKFASRLALAALILMAAVVSDAGPQGCTDYGDLQGFAFEQITVSSTSIGFTATTYAPNGSRAADMAVVTVETNGIRYRDDGVAPTASVGEPVASATSPNLLVCGQPNVKAVRFIRQTSDATISVAYYRRNGIQ